MRNEPIIFVGGLVSGVIAGVTGMYFYYKNRIDVMEQQLKDSDAYIDDLNAKISELESNSYNLVEDNAEINPAESAGYDRSAGPMSEKAREEIREKLVRNYHETTNYAAMSKQNSEERDDVADLVPETPEDEANRAEEEISANKDKPTRIITAEEFGELPPYVDTETLYFFHYDEVLVDDNEEEIDDPSALIGDALTKYDFIDSDETVIFVMNYHLNTAYEIQRVMGSYSEQS